MSSFCSSLGRMNYRKDIFFLDLLVHRQALLWWRVSYIVIIRITKIKLYFYQIKNLLFSSVEII